MLESSPMKNLLTMKGVNKSFGAIHALHNIDLSINAGEVVALVGDNGAGKSTLIKILSGLHRPDNGFISVDSQPVDIKKYNVRLARKLGIETVYQERSLAERQPLWRNLFVGRHLRNRFGLIRVEEEKRLTDELLTDLGFRGVGISSDALIGTLSGGERQGLAIGRAMHFDAKLIILDEPTNALSLHEVNKVLDFIRKIRDSGRSCLLICHNMAQAFEVADRFVFLDRGHIIGEDHRDNLTLESLSLKMLDYARSDYTHSDITAAGVTS